ncbi:hypothetical protein [Bacillus altitudinis]|uniref:hypothetical protein n=1 Tax=Bacillus altitudinis TaxID=293387 RepID=UPI0011A86255|nr:hypothetical protein [Bacillus altitudinis]
MPTRQPHKTSNVSLAFMASNSFLSLSRRLLCMYVCLLFFQLAGVYRSHLTLYYHYTPNLISFIDCFPPASGRILLYASQKR